MSGGGRGQDFSHLTITSQKDFSLKCFTTAQQAPHCVLLPVNHNHEGINFNCYKLERDPPLPSFFFFFFATFWANVPRILN